MDENNNSTLKNPLQLQKSLFLNMRFQVKNLDNYNGKRNDFETDNKVLSNTYKVSCKSF